MNSIFSWIAAIVLLNAAPIGATRGLIFSHPKVVVTNSAHIHSVLRRIASLHRLKDTGAIVTTQNGDGAALRVWHDSHYVAAGVAHPGDVVE